MQKRAHEAGPFESITARDWIESRMGRAPWRKIWGPLLRGKFGERAEDISMAWLWSKLTLRRQLEGDEARQEQLGYPKHSWELLFDALRSAIEAGGGRVLIDRPAAGLSRDGDAVRRGGRREADRFAAATTRGLARLARRPRARGRAGRAADAARAVAAASATTRSSRRSPTTSSSACSTTTSPRRSARRTSTACAATEYHTALCLLLELDRRFSPFYWTNIADTTIPFVGLIEHTNFIDPKRYQGRRFLYVANYLAPGDPLLALSQDELLAAYLPGLRAVQPDFSPDWIVKSWLHREPAAQPIVTVGYHKRIPPLQTGVPGLILANTTQIYPEDRGTNYSVRLGGDAARALLADRS